MTREQAVAKLAQYIGGVVEIFKRGGYPDDLTIEETIARGAGRVGSGDEEQAVDALLRELGLVPTDPARATELGKVAMAGLHTPECEWAVQELVERLSGSCPDDDESARRRYVALDPALVERVRAADRESPSPQREARDAIARTPDDVSAMCAATRLDLADAVMEQLGGDR